MTLSRLGAFALIGLVGLPCAPFAWAAQPVDPASADANVSSTVIRGAQTYPAAPVIKNVLHPGDVSLNFPGADVRDLAKAVLGDLMGVSYRVDPAASGAVTLVTAQPIARADVPRALEEALRAANLALVERGGDYSIAPMAAARAQAPVLAAGQNGFGSETIALNFISAAALKTLLDPLVPGALSIADPTRNVIAITGDTGQRQSIHDLIGQFDVDWLKGMSFALYVPRHTDSRIIVPEIDKLLNGQGAPSAGLVRLIAMEKINGVLAISAQAQYLDDVKRWIEVLDREGESSERRLFVYRVQNGRSADLAMVLNSAFSLSGARSGGSGGAGGSNPPASGAGFDIEAPAPASGPAVGAPVVRPGAAEIAGGQTSGQSNATITSDETNNAVLAYATPREYAVIDDALRKLDIAPTQVLIEAAVTEVTLTHALQYGVQWNFKSGQSQFGLLQNSGGVASPSSSIASAVSGATTVGSAIQAAGQVTPGFNYVFGGSSISATLNALSGITTVNVLSAPKMLVLNNHTASLQVGAQVPVVTASAVSTIGTNAPVVNSVDYRDTGVILKVTPRVNSGGLVLLDIAQEVSDVVATSTSSINSPTIEQRKFATSIAIQDGETIALGGLIRDTKSKGRSGIPFLSAIPILGALAGNQATSDVRTELLILLTPRVIRSAPDAEAITDELRRKIQAIDPIPPIHSLRP
jgi:general secretion pathway protein D